MKAFYLVKNGDPNAAFELRDHRLAEPGPGEVLVKTEAFGLNYADVMARLGYYKDCPLLPTVIGYESVGVVENLGRDVKGLEIGDRVLAFSHFGAYASHVLTNQLAVVQIDSEMDAGVATALGTQYTTAWYALEECMNLHEGDRVLIHAAAGGVGTALIQMAKRRGCIVAGTASSHKQEYLFKQGVDLPIDYRENDFSEVLKKEGWGGKIDAIFDPVGGISVRKGSKLLNAGGKMVLYGSSSMSDSSSPLHKLRIAAGFGLWSPIVLLMRSISLIGVNMLRIAESKPALLHKCLMKVVELQKQGVLHPEVGGVYRSGELAEAHRFLESRDSIGKIVVHWDE